MISMTEEQKELVPSSSETISSQETCLVLTYHHCWSHSAGLWLLSFSFHQFWHSCFECATNIPEHVNTVLFPGYNQNPQRRRLKPELFRQLWACSTVTFYLIQVIFGTFKKKKQHSLHLLNGLKIEIWDSQIMGYPYLKTLSKLYLKKKTGTNN